MKFRLPFLTLSLLIIIAYLVTLSQTTFYYAGEDGAMHIFSLWVNAPILYYPFFLIIYWFITYCTLKVGKDHINKKNKRLRLIAAILSSGFFVVLLTLIGVFLLGLHFENSYWSEGEYEPHLLFKPVYYLHIPVYVLGVFIFDWLMRKLLF